MGWDWSRTLTAVCQRGWHPAQKRFFLRASSHHLSVNIPRSKGCSNTLAVIPANWPCQHDTTEDTLLKRNELRRDRRPTHTTKSHRLEPARCGVVVIPHLAEVTIPTEHSQTQTLEVSFEWTKPS